MSSEPHTKASRKKTRKATASQLKIARDAFRDFPPEIRELFVNNAIRLLPTVGGLGKAIERSFITTEIPFDEKEIDRHLKAIEAVAMPTQMVRKWSMLHDSMAIQGRVTYDRFLSTTAGLAELQELRDDIYRLSLVEATRVLVPSMKAAEVQIFLANNLARKSPLILDDQTKVLFEDDAAQTGPPQQGKSENADEDSDDDKAAEEEIKKKLAELGEGDGDPTEAKKFLNEHPKMGAMIKIVLEQFGIESLYDAIVDGVLLVIFYGLWKAIVALNKSRIKSFLLLIWRFLTGTIFRRLLIRLLGKSRAARIIARVLGKAVPLVGTALLI